MVRRTKKNRTESLKILASTAGRALLLLLMVNTVNLVVEIYKLNMGEQIAVSYSKSYITLNDCPIGLHLYTNALIFLMLTTMSLYNSQKQKTQEL